jgi:hypothetical protein
LRLEHQGDGLHWALTRGPVGWAKMVRIAAATISPWPLGSLVSTVRMKWTRHPRGCRKHPNLLTLI